MKVKICGLTRLEDALFAVEQGVDALGFIFVPSSPRYIDPDAAGCIVRSLPPFVTPVGVFVNETRAKILHSASISGIRTLQLHGDETPADTEGYPIPVIKSFRVGAGFDIAVIGQYLTPAFLLDTLAPGTYGGSGIAFDWTIAVKAKRFGRIILSGGINPGNVEDAITRVQPYAIDVSSGVEESPGVKDHDKIRSLIESARKASRSLRTTT